MDAQLEKAKIILNKTFCFMQLQADAAVKRGETLMEKEICIICGHETEGKKCKHVCPNCGAMRDCSDP